ncbi:MAG: selenide, water dikinase SelD [Candidatus Sabulitectum sp.]|nr:selenide, water dikinase SelD [Candidatus Sabulitectum sp.]
MKQLPVYDSPDLLVGMENMDDAGVYRISDDIALVQTVDFFYPVVNDPRMNGMIAAANSLSDVWAMGAKAHTAMNVLAYPPGLINAEVIGEMLAGGSEKLVEAKVALVGGHTMEQEDLLYGMSVTGTVHPDRIKTNTSANIHDLIILTKPVGTGVYANGMMKDGISDAQYREVTASMSRLNMYAADILNRFRVSAMTDVTGFGLLGHALPIARSSNLTIRIDQNSVPLLSDIFKLLERFTTLGVCKVSEYVEQYLTVQEGVLPDKLKLFTEAETSGGLLVFIHPDDADEALKMLRDNGDERSSIIGSVEELEYHNRYLKVMK